jgi:hypothetical protein
MTKKWRRPPDADRAAWEEEDRPLSAQERAANEHAHKQLTGMLHLMASLNRCDQARSALARARKELDGLRASAVMPDYVREDFERFLKAGGCTHLHYRDWLQGEYRDEPVAQRKHLRLVGQDSGGARSLMVHSRHRCSDDNPPEAA